MNHTVIVDSLTDAESWFDLITNGIIVQNSLGRVVRYNVAALDLLGLSADQMLGLTGPDPRWHMINDDLTPSNPENYPSSRALRTGKPVTDVLLGVFHPEKNRYQWLRVNSHPYTVLGESIPNSVLTTLADMTMWKETRDALLREQQLFRKGPVVAIQTKGETARLTSVSENFEALFSLDPTPFLEGRADLWDRIAPDDRGLLSQAWQTAKNDSKATSFSGRFRFKDGQENWREIAHQTIFGRSSTGREPETLAYWLDRTDEAHLLRRLTLTLDAARVGTWDWSNQTGRVVFDAGWGRLTGYLPEDVADMTMEKWYELIHPSDQDLWRYMTEQLVQGGAMAIDIEVRQRQRSGAWSWYQIRGKAFEVDGGRPVRVLGIQEDVSHRVAAEQERSALSQVVEQGPSAVILTDVLGNIEYVNRQFTLQTGYDLSEVQGQNPRIWKSPDANPVTYREMWATLTAGQTWHGEFKNRKKDGTPYWVQCSISPLTDASGQVYRYAGQQIDISARKAVDDSLKQAREDADAANHAKSDFLAHMSHEIRTPMNGILGMADLALSRPLDAQSRGHIETIKISAEALLSLVNDILDVSKIEAGMMELESISFSLAEMVQTVLKPLLILAKKKGLLLEVRRDEVLADWRNGDPTRLGQILTNLVSNAVKFTPEGSVTVTLTDDKSNLVGFAVRDSGPGVPADHRNRLFQRFSQTEASTTRNFGGSGLGLAICRELVNKMGGEIGYKDAFSPPGGIFWFSVPLPVVARPAASRSPVSMIEEPLSWKHARVLVVEDNDVNQQVALGLLQRYGIVPTVASTGIDALRILNTGAFDLVFMDVQMPVMDGVTATKAIRRGEGGEQHRRVPIIAMTANAMGGDREACLGAGMDDYLTKPISAAQFSGLLKKWGENLRRASQDPWSVDTFDLDEMRERLQLEDEMVVQIVRLFLNGLPGRRQAVLQAAESKQTDELLRLAHTIKGTAANLVARGVVEAALALESAASLGNEEQTGLRVKTLLTELDLLQAALGHFSQSWESALPAH